DYLTFGRMLLAGGMHDGQRLLSAELVEAMTTNHLTAEQLATSAPDPTSAQGWGLCVAVQVRDAPGNPAGSYGWAGGLGSSWSNAPASGIVGVLLTNAMFSSPQAPPVHVDFWTALRG